MSEKPGLRERKKKETRLAISGVATRMFIERGFDQVTIAEVAEAAKVSVNTIFNYFVTKEDLFFDLGDEVVAATSQVIKDRSLGESAVGALYRRFHEMMEDEGGLLGARNLKPFIATVEASPALQARARLLFEQAEAHLAKTLQEETRAALDDPAPRVVAAMVMGLVSLFFREFRAAVLADKSPEEYRTMLAMLGERGFAMLRTGVGSYCTRQP